MSINLVSRAFSHFLREQALRTRLNCVVKVKALLFSTANRTRILTKEFNMLKKYLITCKQQQNYYDY